MKRSGAMDTGMKAAAKNPDLPDLQAACSFSRTPLPPQHPSSQWSCRRGRENYRNRLSAGQKQGLCSTDSSGADLAGMASMFGGLHGWV